MVPRFANRRHSFGVGVVAAQDVSDFNWGKISRDDAVAELKAEAVGSPHTARLPRSTRTFGKDAKGARLEVFLGEVVDGRRAAAEGGE